MQEFDIKTVLLKYRELKEQALNEERFAISMLLSLQDSEKILKQNLGKADIQKVINNVVDMNLKLWKKNVSLVDGAKIISTAHVNFFKECLEKVSTEINDIYFDDEEWRYEDFGVSFYRVYNETARYYEYVVQSLNELANVCKKINKPNLAQIIISNAEMLKKQTIPYYRTVAKMLDEQYANFHNVKNEADIKVKFYKLNKPTKILTEYNLAQDKAVYQSVCTEPQK